MEQLRRYKVTGVSRSHGSDVQMEFDALNESNARVKAELQGIVVTSVERFYPPACCRTDLESVPKHGDTSLEPALSQSQASTEVASGSLATPPPIPEHLDDSSRRRSAIFATIGWVVSSIAMLAATGHWVSPHHRRDPAIETMIQHGDGDAIALGLAFLVGINILGIVGAILGVVVFFLNRRTNGLLLVSFCLTTIGISTAGQLRPNSESLAGTGFTTTTTPQAKQAVKDMSRMFDRAIPPPGEVPSVAPDAIASSNVHGELSHLVKVTQDLLAGMLADLNEYQNGVLALRLESVLLPMRLDSTAEINDSKAKIASAQALFNKYDAAVRARMTAARAGLASAPYAPSVRAGLLRNFDKGMATTMPQMEKVLLYEAEMYAELTALLDFMLTQQGKFNQVGNQLKFDDEADAATYNASLTRYQAIAAKQIALQALMEEGARANSERFRRAVDAGVFDDMPAAATAVVAAPMRIELNPDGAIINGRAVAFPLTVAEMTAILGPPSRTVAIVNTIRVWDAVGIYTYSKPGSQEVDSIAIAINRQHEYDFSPKKVYGGPIILAFMEVRDIDTPRSLNRRLKGIAFKNFDPWGLLWDIHFPTYSVGMSVDKAGLSDTITVRGRRADQGEGAKSRF